MRESREGFKQGWIVLMIIIFDGYDGSTAEVETSWIRPEKMKRAVMGWQSKREGMNGKSWAS